MNYILQTFLLLLLCRLLTVAGAGGGNGSNNQTLVRSPSRCSDELVSFSLCLPYVAASPNNLTDSPPRQCCEDVSASLVNGSSICLCYFIRRPNILGFPLNSTRLLSLASVCQLRDRITDANFTIESLCSGLAALPPLRSITGPSNSVPHYTGIHSPPPPSNGSSAKEPTISPAEEPGDDEVPSHPTLSLPDMPTTISLATQTPYGLSKTLLTSLLIISLFHQFKDIDGPA